MAKIKYQAKENSRLGTHSFYAVPVFNGTLTMDELLEEALDGKSVESSVARAAIVEFMKAVKRNVLKGFRCQLGDDFLTVYPNISLSVKDKDGVVATASMLNAGNAKSRLGCTVNAKFSDEFEKSVSWQRIDGNGAVVEGEDATQGNENVDSGTDNTQTGTTETSGSTDTGGSTGDGGGDIDYTD